MNAFQKLEDLDRQLMRGRLETLNPVASRPSTLGEIGQKLLGHECDAELADPFVSALTEIALAFHENFPENLFADLDFVALQLMTAAKRDPDLLRETSGCMVRLLEIYGANSPIRFRYVHDFLYGFDWARWVSKSWEEREHIAPFDLEFLFDLESRGIEIIELVSINDPEYPELESDRYRNIFEYSREPEHERALLHDLAMRGLIPVWAWSIEAKPVWNKPFRELRKERAEALGLPPNGK